MNNKYFSVSSSDQIFATLVVGGKVMANVCKCNFSSVDEIVRLVSSLAGRFMGLARLSIRNKTQGWTMNMALASRQSQRQSPVAAMPVQYRQASLFA